MQTQLYLFDSKIYKERDLIIFGYLQRDINIWQKVELSIEDFDISLQMNIDYNIFKDAEQMVEKYLFQKNKQLKNTIKDYKEIYGKFPFKGAQTEENKQGIVEFIFNDFKQYDMFQNKIQEINNQLIQRLQSSDKYSQCDLLLDGLLLKEQQHILKYLRNELKQQSNYIHIQYVEQLISQFISQPCRGSAFFENQQLYTTVDTYELFEKLQQNYHFTTELVKYPFRLLENDNKQNYILKLLRHSKCQLAGFNEVILSTNTIQDSRDYSRRLQLKCRSLDDIKFVEQSNNNVCPLNLLSWDIEVCTETGNFDNDGKNQQNKVLCIGLSLGMLQPSQPQKQQQTLDLNNKIMNDKTLNVCISWVDSSDNQLTMEEFIQEYKHKFNNGNVYNDNQHNSRVIRVQTETQMIQGFFQLVNLFDPSFITGFNDFQFDYPFIRDKISTFDVSEGQFKIIQLLYNGFKTQLNNKTYMGDLFQSQSIKISASDKKAGISLEVMGIISIDTRILLMKTQKLEKKSLNDYLIANKIPTKLEVSFRDMNTAFKYLTTNVNKDKDQQIYKSSKQNQQITKEWSMNTLRDVFKYCMYDCQACYLLWTKRNILQQAVEVSKLSYTPLRCSFLNADGIKVRNMVAKFAFDKGYSVPMTIKSQDIRLRDIQLLQKYEKYPGAYVSPPKKGISLTPVSALDFESLYPSIIMAHNLSPEKVIEPNEIIYFDVQTTQIEIPFQKEDQSEVLYGNVLTRDDEVGVYPSILKFLFDSRKQVKLTIEHLNEQLDQLEETSELRQDIDFQITLLNCKQLAIKVFMNTFYGETGNQKSPLFDVIISGGTTTLGQKYIKQVHKYIEDRDCEIVYGDSIVFDEPLLLKDKNNQVVIKTIESLMQDDNVQKYGFDKEQQSCPYKIWTNGDWLQVKRVIRHKVNKKIYRVYTKDSIVEVTEDHSLINCLFQQIKPENAIGQTILESIPFQPIQGKKQLNQLQLQKITLKSKLFDIMQQIPHNIINGTTAVQRLFVEGIISNYNKIDNCCDSINYIDCKTKLIAQQMYYICVQLSFHPTLTLIENHKKIIYRISLNTYQVQHSDVVYQIELIKNTEEQYVYDIETDLGIFGAGIGRMTLKNTDSVYFRPRFSHFELYKQNKPQYPTDTKCSISSEMLSSAYEATETIKKEINKIIGDQTGNFLRMAFEELLFPSMFTGKKKYCGVVYVPGKMELKSQLSMKDILLRGIDFIKSQYPEIIKEVGRQTLIDIMMHFIQLINKNNQQQQLSNEQSNYSLSQLFQDDYRNNINGQLKDLIQGQIQNLYFRLQNIRPDQYQTLSSKKKLRSAKTGQMMLFKQRIMDIQSNIDDFVFSQLKDYVLTINIQELQQFGISAPEDGEVLDLISIEPPTIFNASDRTKDIKLKSSELIYLTQYAQRKILPINIDEYLKMYRTTASRILVSAFFDDSIEDPDLQEKQAMKQAKSFCDNCTAIDKTQQLIQQQENIISQEQQKLQQNPKISYNLKSSVFLQTHSGAHSIALEKIDINDNQLYIEKINQQILKFNNLIEIQRSSKQISQIYSIEQLIQRLQFNKNIMYILVNHEVMIQKLQYLQESNSTEKLKSIHQYLDIVFCQFQEYNVIPIITAVIQLIQNQCTDIKIEQLQIYAVIKRLIQTIQWKKSSEDLKQHIYKQNKLPLEMSELHNWLFKQRSIYIELTKIKLKQQQEEQRTESIEKQSKIGIKGDNLKVGTLGLPIQNLSDFDIVINETLISHNKLIQDFFEESIWDLHYQISKKTANKQWIKQQYQKFQSGQLPQSKVLKMMKIDSNFSK